MRGAKFTYHTFTDSNPKNIKLQQQQINTDNTDVIDSIVKLIGHSPVRGKLV